MSSTFQIGDITINTWMIIKIAIIMLMSIFVAKTVHFFLNRHFNRSSEILKVDPTRYRFFKNAISMLIYGAGIMLVIYTIPSLRSLALTLFAGAGIFAAILGFASQQAFSNIISGIFIVSFRPFRVGDIIRIGELYGGTVEDITLRHTVIRDWQNQRIIIPNSVISSETVLNLNIGDEKIRRAVEFEISYDSDIDKAIQIIREEAESHKFFIDNRTLDEIERGHPPCIVRNVGFGDSSIKLKAYAWAKNFDDAFEMHCDLNKSVKKRFDLEGIEIPFPYRTIVFKDKQKDLLNG